MATMDDVKTEAEIDLMKANTAKAIAETRKVIRETGMVPFVAGAGFMLAATALATLLLRYMVH
jgi:hypothetical protein